MVSKFFDEIDCKVQNREFVTHTGTLNNKRISVVSTGIGIPNIDIVLNELDALHNIDFSTREIKEKITSLNIVRIGTAGGLQKDVPVGTYILTSHALGLDGLMHYYKMSQSESERHLSDAVSQYFAEKPLPINPYVSSAESPLFEKLKSGFQTGITATCLGFYAPQDRQLRFKRSHPNLLDELADFSFQNEKIYNFEMETSAIYGLGKCLGHQCCSTSIIINNRHTKEFIKNLDIAVEKFILYVLERLKY